MQRIRKKVVGHRNKIILLALLFAVATVGFVVRFGGTLFAADEIWVEKDGVQLPRDVPVELRDQTMQLMLGSSGEVYVNNPDYMILWSTPNDDIISIQADATGSIANVSAVSPGMATINLQVLKNDGTGDVVANTSCLVNVVFAIDTSWDNTIFQYVFEDSPYRALVAYVGDDVTLRTNLPTGAGAIIQWTTIPLNENNEVAEIDQDTGELTAIGAGRTLVNVTYQPDGSADSYSADLDVFVVPKVYNESVGQFTNAMTLGIENNGFIETDALFKSTNIDPIQSKVTWVIKKDTSNGANPPEVIADSLGKSSPLINLQPLNSNSNTFQVQAVAGKYQILFYPVGTYESESRNLRTPTVVNLTVYANCHNLTETLQIGDIFSLAEAFNMTLEDFTNTFRVPPGMQLQGGGDATPYVDFAPESVRFTTKRKGIVEVTAEPRIGEYDGLWELLHPDVRREIEASGMSRNNYRFNLVLNIIDYFYLDRSSVTMVVGETLRLSPVTTTVFRDITWTSSNSRYVSVDENGQITALMATSSLTSDVVITATMDMGNGLFPQATCTVKVEPNISNVTLEPTSLTMRVGDSATVMARMNQSASVAPLIWESLDTNIFSVVAATDNKSAVVTAKKGGEASLTVTNSLTSRLMATMKVRVVILIEGVNFPQGNISDDLFRGGKQVVYNVTPTTANTNDLVWKSADESVATVSSSGYITYKKAGTVMISAYSASNTEASGSFFLTIRQSAESIDIQPKTATVEAGGTIQFSGVLKPANSENKITWSVMNANVATVSQTGLVTAKSAGKTQVWMSAEGVGAPVAADITVTQKSTKIAFADEEITLAVEGTFGPPETIITPANSTDGLTWNSLDTSVVTVDANGVLTGVKQGSTYLQVKTASGQDAIIPVFVKQTVKGLALNKDTGDLMVGESFNITPIFTPEEPFDTGVTWASSDASVASVVADEVDGVVTALKPGTTIISAVSNDGGYQAVCLVTVHDLPSPSPFPTPTPVPSPTPPPPPAEITLNHNSYFLKLKKSVKLTATVVRAGVETKEAVTWFTSNSKVATVSSTGSVKGKKIGRATIQARTTDGAVASCAIRVVRKATRITLNKSQLKILEASTYKLKARVSPANATIKKVQWTSEDTEIATVDPDGRVTAIKPGVVKVRATTTDGSNRSAFCLVTVKERVGSTGITATSSELIIVKGTSVSSGLTVEPKNSTDRMSYSSDNRRVARVTARGKIVGRAIGEATIYATTPDGHSGYVDVTVVGMNRRAATMQQYDTQNVWVNGIDENVKWYSKNPRIATIANGKIVARHRGRTTVYAVIQGTRVPCRVRVVRIK